MKSNKSFVIFILIILAVCFLLAYILPTWVSVGLLYALQIFGFIIMGHIIEQAKKNEED